MSLQVLILYLFLFAVFCSNFGPTILGMFIHNQQLIASLNALVSNTTLLLNGSKEGFLLCGISYRWTKKWLLYFWYNDQSNQIKGFKGLLLAVCQSLGKQKYATIYTFFFLFKTCYNTILPKAVILHVMQLCKGSGFTFTLF